MPAILKYPRLVLVLAVPIVMMVAAPAAAEEPHFDNMTRDDDVWIKWSAVSNLQEKDRLENGTIHFPEGHEWTWGVKLRNNKSVNITDVTVVPQVDGPSIEYTLYETYAGGPAREDFAYWAEVEPTSDNLVIMHMKTKEGTEGSLDFDYLTFFSVDGEERFSITEYNGKVEPSDDGGEVRSQDHDRTTNSSESEREVSSPSLLGLLGSLAVAGLLGTRNTAS
jgi:hypothetical protein